MRVGMVFVAGLAAALSCAPAAAKCSVANFAVLNVTMQGTKAMTDAEINGHSVRFIVDSGAFFSVIAPATAREFGLSVDPMPANFELRGIGGSASAGVTKVGALKLAGISLKGIQFIVGGSDTGSAGVLGQNVLGLRDVEYDLQHGAVRLMDPKDCAGQGMAYWANGKPVTELPIEEVDDRDRHTIATVLVNGVKMRAVFDTGAAGTSITPAAAKRAGVTPDSPGAVKDGYAHGVGSRQVVTWRAPFDNFELGGEKLHHVILAVHDLGGDADMLIGADFFLSHRVYVANSDRRIFFTYEGGPVFGVNPSGAVTGTGDKIALTDSGQEPTDAAGYNARGTAAASRKDYASALADLNHAVEMAPNEGRYYFQRAQIRLALRQQPLAFEDLDMAHKLAPTDPDILMAHAAMARVRRDQAAASDDLKAADGVLPQEADSRLRLASLYAVFDNQEAALANFDSWLHFHGEDAERPAAFNGRCYARAILNRELDKALSDCNTAIRLRPGTAAYYDSRALVHLRRGDYKEAVDDYTTTLNLQPNMVMTRYLRGIAEGKLGQSEAAKKDHDAAVAVDAKVATAAARLGF